MAEIKTIRQAEQAVRKVEALIAEHGSQLRLLRERVNQIPGSGLIIGSSAFSGGGGGVTDHGNLTGLSDDDHTQYALSTHAFLTLDTPARLTNLRQPQGGLGISLDDGGPGGALTWSVEIGSPAGLTFSGNALVVDDLLAGSGLLMSSKVMAVGQGDGISVTANAVALTTPGSLTVSTGNSSAGNHTHAIVSSSNPGAAASILASSAAGYLQLIRLGLQVAPLYPLHVAASTTQARLEYNTNNYAHLTVESNGALRVTTGTDAAGGSLLLDPVGDIVVNPTGNDMYPQNNYDVNLGILTKKWLSIHGAELWVQTLVAEETIATYGGHIFVAPSNQLIADLAAS